MSTNATVAAPAGFRWSSILEWTALPLILVIVWQLFAMTFPADSPAPSPLRVVNAFVELVTNGGLIQATLQSLGRVLVGFLFALVGQPLTPRGGTLAPVRNGAAACVR